MPVTWLRRVGATDVCVATSLDKKNKNKKLYGSMSFIMYLYVNASSTRSPCSFPNAALLCYARRGIGPIMKHTLNLSMCDCRLRERRVYRCLLSVVLSGVTAVVVYKHTNTNFIFCRRILDVNFAIIAKPYFNSQRHFDISRYVCDRTVFEIRLISSVFQGAYMYAFSRKWSYVPRSHTNGEHRNL